MASLSAPITALRQRFSSRKRRGVAGELDLGDPQVQLEQLGDRLRERRAKFFSRKQQICLFLPHFSANKVIVNRDYRSYMP